MSTVIIIKQPSDPDNTDISTWDTKVLHPPEESIGTYLSYIKKYGAIRYKDQLIGSNDLTILMNLYANIKFRKDLIIKGNEGIDFINYSECNYEYGKHTIILIVSEAFETDALMIECKEPVKEGFKVRFMTKRDFEFLDKYDINNRHIPKEIMELMYGREITFEGYDKDSFYKNYDIEYKISGMTFKFDTSNFLEKNSARRLDDFYEMLIEKFGVDYDKKFIGRFLSKKDVEIYNTYEHEFRDIPPEILEIMHGKFMSFKNNRSEFFTHEFFTQEVNGVTFRFQTIHIISAKQAFNNNESYFITDEEREFNLTEFGKDCKHMSCGKCTKWGDDKSDPKCYIEGRNASTRGADSIYINHKCLHYEKKEGVSNKGNKLLIENKDLLWLK